MGSTKYFTVSNIIRSCHFESVHFRMSRIHDTNSSGKRFVQARLFIDTRSHVNPNAIYNARVGCNGVIPIVQLLYKTSKIDVGQSGFWVVKGHSI